MKINFILAALTAGVLLSACGEKHEAVHAVDKLEEAQAAAKAKAPQPEAIKFDDEGQPPFAEPKPAEDAAKTDESKADEKTADAAKPAEADKAEEAKPAEAATEVKTDAPAEEKK